MATEIEKEEPKQEELYAFYNTVTKTFWRKSLHGTHGDVRTFKTAKKAQSEYRHYARPGLKIVKLNIEKMFDFSEI